MTDKLTQLSLSETVELIKGREISSLELVRAHLERIEQLDPKINSFITITEEAALGRARQADSEAQRGETVDGKTLGLLHGIPIAVKDLYEMKGVLTTLGSKFFAKYVPETNAIVVDKMFAAGAVNLGKLNMHEIALGLTTINPHFGACRNPWALDRIPGGSSGGSGAALAAGLCMGSLGSDTGGSIRVPASLCGVVGLKPTYGRVSLRGVLPLSWNLDHAGPMARKVLDVAILLQVIAGYDPDDPYSIKMQVDDYSEQIRNGVRGWRIALAEGDFFDRTDPQVAQIVRDAAGVFGELGAEVEPVVFSGARQAAIANGLMVRSDAAAYHQERLQTRPEDFGPDIKERLMEGAAHTSTEYVMARRDQTRLRREFEAFFDTYDLLLTPTTVVPAPPIDELDAVAQARSLTRYTAPFNLTGLPALSLPCGFVEDGLPVGLQIVARPWAEASLLRAAYAYERATDWHLRSPRL